MAVKYRVIFDLGIGRPDHVIYHRDFDYQIDANDMMIKGKALFHKQGYIYRGMYENWWMYENAEKGLRSRSIVMFIDDGEEVKGSVFRRRKKKEEEE